MLQILNAEISLIGILLAVVANMVIGMLWFGPLFGEQWMKSIGKKKSELEAKGSDYAITLVSALMTATFMSLLISYGFVSSQLVGLANSFDPDSSSDFLLSGAWSDIASAIIIALFVWIAATVPVLTNRLVWEGSDRKLIAINAGHTLVSILSMGLIVAIAMDLG